MPAKSDDNTPPAESEPAPFEVATLAAAFLPPIDLPEKWQTEHPQSLSEEIGKSTGNPFPRSTYRPPEGWRTPWEVLCEEAVKRARTLLDTTAGRTRPAVLAWDAAGADARAQLDRIHAEHQKIAKEFDRVANGRKTVPVADVLRFCLPRAKSDEVRMAYFMSYLYEDASGYNQRHGIEGPPVIADQTDRTVNCGEFPIFVRDFVNAYKERGEAWRKEFARAAGKQGGAKAKRERRQSETAEGIGPALSAADAARLDAASRKHTAKRRKK